MSQRTQPGPDVLKERPFYFMMNVWGDEFRWMFLNLCLASLLSTRNIPALVNKTDSRFLILSPREDLDALASEPLIAKLREYITVQFIEIPSPGAGDDKFDLNTFSYKLAADLCFDKKAYGVFLCPDTLLSDGTVVALQERARQGAKVVLVAALRHDQRAIISELKQSRDINLGAPLCFPPRAMMKLGLAHLHPQAFLHDWSGGTFNRYPGFALWRVPGGDGLILHTMRWNPLLISYADIKSHQTWSRFGGTDHIGMDDDYIFNNFGDGEDIQAVTDTDEIAYVSLTPTETGASHDITHGEFNKRTCLRVMAYGRTMDPLQWRLFRAHIRMHSGDITPVWTALEGRIDAILHASLARRPSSFDKAWQSYGARGLSRLAVAAWRRLTGASERPVQGQR
jgi:hypothetical protein